MKTPKVSLQLVIGFFLFLSTINLQIVQSSTIEVSGDITENTSWTDDTVRLTGHVNVLKGVTLTILPGTHVTSDGKLHF